MEVIISPTVAGISDIGRKHNQNEDYMVLSVTKDGDLVLVVCDGVSRSQNQQLGSKVGCQTARDTILQLLGGGTADSKEMVKTAIKAAQDAICKVPFDPNVKDSSGNIVDPAQSTIVACLIQGGKKVTIGWAGDSRGYWITPKWVYPLTRDDSWLDAIVASGKMTLEEALKRPEAHAITKSLGAADDGSNPGIDPSVVVMNVAEPGRLLLCSDGFWNYAEDPAVIRKLVDAQPANADALSLSRALVNFANQQGGKDNVTAIFACL
jgi:serine/threonine protein phosphatase PrpC